MRATHAARVSSRCSFCVPLPTGVFTGTEAQRRTLGQVIFNYSNRAATFTDLPSPFVPSFIRHSTTGSSSYSARWSLPLGPFTVQRERSPFFFFFFFTHDDSLYFFGSFLFSFPFALFPFASTAFLICNALLREIQRDFLLRASSYATGVCAYNTRGRMRNCTIHISRIPAVIHRIVLYFYFKKQNLH